MPLTLSLNLNDHSGAAIDMLKAAQHPAASSLIAKMHSKPVVAAKPNPSASVGKNTVTSKRKLSGPYRM